MSRTLAALAAFTLAAIIAVVISRGAGEPDRTDPGADRRLVPELAGRMAGITRLRIVGPGDQVALTLRRSGDTWTVDQRAGYRADAAKLRRLVSTVADLQVVEAKTRDPALYTRLAVEDMAHPDAQGLRLEVEGLDQPLRLIVGRASAAGGRYVRRDGEPQSFEVQPDITLEPDPALWLDRRLLALDGKRVQSISVTPPKGRGYSIERDDASAADFRLTGVPAGRRPYNSAAANPQARALAAFDIDDVRRLGDDGFVPDAGTLVYRTFDGLVLTLEARREADLVWLRVTASLDTRANPPVAVRAEVEALTGRTRGFAFAIPAYRLETLIRPVEDFLGP